MPQWKNQAKPELMTIADWEEAQRSAAAAQVAANAKRAKQAEHRATLTAELRHLDLEIEPLLKAQERADERLQEVRRRLVGQCRVDKDESRRNPSGVYCTFGAGPEKFWNRIAWLRVVKTGEGRWEWTVDLTELNQNVSQTIFGPPSDDPIADFDRYRLKVEEMLAGSGYILMNKERP